MAKLRETILCLQALAAHVKALKAVLTVVVAALERTTSKPPFEGSHFATFTPRMHPSMAARAVAVTSSP